MREVLPLAALELRGMFGINRAIHTRDPKACKRNALLAGTWILLLVIAAGYVGGLVYGLCTLRLSAIVPAYLTVLASALIFIFGLFRAGHAMFGQRGYDMLAAMPIRPGNIVLSRFIALYVEDLLLTLVILLPGCVTFGACQHPGIGFYCLALLGTFFIPAIPLVASILLGTGIMAISARMKHKSLVQTLLMVALVLGVLTSSFTLGEGAETMTAEAFTVLAQNLGNILDRYPPAAWMNHGLSDGRMDALLLFAGISLLLMAATILLVGRFFHPIMRGLMSVSAKHAYRISGMESRGMLKALYLREMKQYFASSIYVTNTIIGPIMACVMAVGLWATGLETITSVLPPELEIPPLLPFAFGAVMCMMPTTCAAISMEGKQFWTIQTLPIPANAWLGAKILLNLSLMLPFYLIGEIFLGLAARPDVLEMIWLLLIPGAMMVFCTVLGIRVNLRFHRFDWTKAEEVVKQGVSTLLGGFAGVILATAMGGIILVIPAACADLVRILLLVGLLWGAWLLRKKNNTVNLSHL